MREARRAIHSSFLTTPHRCLLEVGCVERQRASGWPQRFPGEREAVSVEGRDGPHCVPTSDRLEAALDWVHRASLPKRRAGWFFLRPRSLGADVLWWPPTIP